MLFENLYILISETWIYSRIVQCVSVRSQMCFEPVYLYEKCPFQLSGIVAQWAVLLPHTWLRCHLCSLCVDFAYSLYHVAFHWRV